MKFEIHDEGGYFKSASIFIMRLIKNTAEQELPFKKHPETICLKLNVILENLIALFYRLQENIHMKDDILWVLGDNPFRYLHLALKIHAVKVS